MTRRRIPRQAAIPSHPKGATMTTTATVEGSRKAKPSEVKEFFSAPGKPVTNTELIEFKQTDPAGYDELANLLGAHLAAAGK